MIQYKCDICGKTADYLWKLTYNPIGLRNPNGIILGNKIGSVDYPAIEPGEICEGCLKEFTDKFNRVKEPLDTCAICKMTRASHSQLTAKLTGHEFIEDVR